jgi:hypothetical protein
MVIEDRLSIGARLARMRFPSLDSRVDVLLRRDGNFRNMCEELAELDCAVSTLNEVGGRREVLADWEAARDRLTKEMGDALSRVT